MAAVSIKKTNKTAAYTACEPAVEDAILSGEMEGLSVDAEFEVEAAAYASGVIDIDEFGRSVRARNGVA